MDDEFLKKATLVCEFSGDEVELINSPETSDNRGIEGIADSYRIYRHPRCLCGLIVYAKHGAKWDANPHSIRAVIQFLLKKSKL